MDTRIDFVMMVTTKYGMTQFDAYMLLSESYRSPFAGEQLRYLIVTVEDICNPRDALSGETITIASA